MAEREVLVLCYWNGCVKYGPDGVYYQGLTPRKISVKQKTEFTRLLDGIHIITGVDKQTSKFEIFGRYPLVVSPHQITYVHLPVVNDISLATMLEVPSKYPSINYVELYLEVKPTIDPNACSSPLENDANFSKRQRTQQSQEANGDVIHQPVKLESDDGLQVQGVYDNNGWNADFRNSNIRGGRDEELTDKNTDLDGLAQAVNLTSDNGDLNVPGLEASANACLNKGITSSDSQPWCQSNLWVDDHELDVGLGFKDIDDLKKAVEWCCIRRQQKYVVQECGKDEYLFECIRWKCKWSLCAARMERHGVVEITKYTGPHTCCPIVPAKFDSVFAAEEVERLIRVQPTLTIAELKSWWFEKFGYKLETKEIQAAKQEAVRNIYGDWDQSFRLLPKLMAAFHGLVVDWQYDVFPNPEFASFCGVFWAFPQSIEGFQHCRPLIVVDAKDWSSTYPMKVMAASGLDAENYLFPLAFAITKEVSSDSWRWFLNGIREKVTQRKGICLISSPHPDILAVINEPGSLWKEPWAYHRFCLDHLSSEFDSMFKNCWLKGLVKQAGTTLQQDEFDSLMETIKKVNPEARRWLDQIPPHQWALSHDNGRRYDVISIDPESLFDFCKSFQSLGLSVTAFALLVFDELRLYFHRGLCDSRGRIKRGNMYTKPVMDRLEEFRTSSTSVTYVVMPLDNNAFQVTTPLQKDGWIVQLNDSTCTCGEFQVNKFPCLHALAACEKLRLNPLRYVDNYYFVERLYRTYAATFSTVPEVSAWPEASGVPTLLPPIIVTSTNVSGKSKHKTTRTLQKKNS